jgi:hypothetical protein
MTSAEAILKRAVKVDVVGLEVWVEGVLVCTAQNETVRDLVAAHYCGMQADRCEE